MSSTIQYILNIYTTNKLKKKTEQNTTNQKHMSVKQQDDKYSESFAANNNLKIEAIKTESIINQLNISQLKLLKVGGGNIYLLEKIGAGSFGKVVKGLYCNGGMQYVAIKRITNNTNQERLKYEIDTLKKIQKLNHQNLVKFIDSFQKNGKCYIVMELCDKGDLSILEHVLDGELRKLTTLQKIDIIHQMINALKALHDKEIAHRDIKLQNMFYQKKENEIIIKLGDFGFSIHKDSPLEYCRRLVGSPNYMSPDLLDRFQKWSACKEQHIEGYINKAKQDDIWALGVAFYEFLSRMSFVPNSIKKHKTAQECIKYISEYVLEYSGLSLDALESGLKYNELKGEIGEKFGKCISSKLKNLLSMMLTHNAKDRATIDVVYNEWNKIKQDIEGQLLQFKNLADNCEEEHK